MKVTIDRAIPLRLYTSKKGAQYLTLAVPDGEVVFSATDIDLSKVPMLQPVSLTAEVLPLRFGNNQALRLVDVTIKQI